MPAGSWFGRRCGLCRASGPLRNESYHPVRHGHQFGFMATLGAVRVRSGHLRRSERWCCRGRTPAVAVIRREFAKVHSVVFFVAEAKGMAGLVESARLLFSRDDLTFHVITSHGTGPVPGVETVIKLQDARAVGGRPPRRIRAERAPGKLTAGAWSMWLGYRDDDRATALVSRATALVALGADSIYTVWSIAHEAPDLIASTAAAMAAGELDARFPPAGRPPV